MSRSAEQFRQLGDVAGDAPRLIHRQHVGDLRVSLCLARVDIGQGLTVGVFDFITARCLLDSPWWREAFILKEKSTAAQKPNPEFFHSLLSRVCRLHLGSQKGRGSFGFLSPQLGSATYRHSSLEQAWAGTGLVSAPPMLPWRSPLPEPSCDYDHHCRWDKAWPTKFNKLARASVKAIATITTSTVCIS